MGRCGPPCGVLLAALLATSPQCALLLALTRAQGTVHFRMPACSSVAGDHVTGKHDGTWQWSLIQSVERDSQVVLATCLSALKKGHGELCGGARHLLTRNLLSAKALPAAAAEAGGQGCLAARVLSPRADVQAWLRAAIARFRSRATLHGMSALVCRSLWVLASISWPFDTGRAR